MMLLWSWWSYILIFSQEGDKEDHQPVRISSALADEGRPFQGCGRLFCARLPTWPRTRLLMLRFEKTRHWDSCCVGSHGSVTHQFLNVIYGDTKICCSQIRGSLPSHHAHHAHLVNPGPRVPRRPTKGSFSNDTFLFNSSLNSTLYACRATCCHNINSGTTRW